MNNEVCEHNFFGDGCPKCQERRIVVEVPIKIENLTEDQAKNYIKLCMYCLHFGRCKWLLSRIGDEAECDWIPSRYKEKEI